MDPDRCYSKQFPFYSQPCPTSPRAPLSASTGCFIAHAYSRSILLSLRDCAVAMAFEEALRFNSFEIWLEEALSRQRVSNFDHFRIHEDQTRRKRRSGTGAYLEQKQVQEKASVHYF